MCGRVYQTYRDEELYFQYLNKRPLIPVQFTPVYNLCPTLNSPVLAVSGWRPPVRRDALAACSELGAYVQYETLDHQRQKRDGVRQSTIWRIGNPPALHRANKRLLRMEDGRAAKASVQDSPEEQLDHESCWNLGYVATWYTGGTSIVFDSDNGSESVHERRSQ